MSLQPYLTQFTGPQKLRIRMRIQKLIFKELYKDDIDDWRMMMMMLQCSLAVKDDAIDKS